MLGDPLLTSVSISLLHTHSHKQTNKHQQDDRSSQKMSSEDQKVSITISEEINDTTPLTTSPKTNQPGRQSSRLSDDRRPSMIRRLSSQFLGEPGGTPGNPGGGSTLGLAAYLPQGVGEPSLSLSFSLACCDKRKRGVWTGQYRTVTATCAISRHSRHDELLCVPMIEVLRCRFL